MKKAIVLLSSGLDSTVNLYRAIQDLQVVLALHFNYGQRAAKQERLHAEMTAKQLNVPFQVVELPWFNHFSDNSLTNSTKDMVTNVEIASLEASRESAKNVWVPNRNGIFLNVAAAFAEQLKADYVIPGFNAEEGATFPDNTPEYMTALDESFRFSTANQVKTLCYTVNMNKPEIYSLGKELGVDYSHVWTCYQSFDKPCGICESCSRFKNAELRAKV
jgi:7-cyano-7-deazaguanine synthase